MVLERIFLIFLPTPSFVDVFMVTFFSSFTSCSSFLAVSSGGEIDMVVVVVVVVGVRGASGGSDCTVAKEK